MAFSDIRLAVANILKAVDGIGQVHEFRRHSTTWEEIFSRHKKDGQINNWEISRTSFDQQVVAVGTAAGNEPTFHVTHAVQILGYMSLDDSAGSEKTFQDLVEAIRERLRENIMLPNTSGTQTVIVPAVIIAPIVEHRMFGPVLTHFAQINITAIERVGGC